MEIRVPPLKLNLLDRVVGYVSPARAMDRLRARAGLGFLFGLDGGGYDAGKSDKKALQRYNPRVRSARGDVNPGLDKMRARSRDQVRNNPLAAGALNTTVTSTVGAGLTCQPHIDQDVLGLSDEQADAWEKQALRWWNLWSETTECDIESELTFGQLQSLAFRAVLESGDVLRIRRFLWDPATTRPRRGDAFGTKLQLVEADRVSNPEYKPDTERVSGGVEIDADGRPISYWVQTAHPGDTLGFRPLSKWNPVPTRDPKTGQRLAQLLFHKQRPGQRRGVPYLAPVIQALKQLERYSESELMAAVISSMFTVFVKSELGADASPLMGIEDADATPAAAGDVFLGNGLVVDLAPGEDVETANPGRPNAAFDPFVMAILRQVGVALELPFEILIKHFQSSYSASRGALLEAWKFFVRQRRWLVNRLCQPAYEDVIAELVARGLIEAPGFFESPVIRRAWLGSQWTGDAMPQIDPLKEANAAGKRVELGISTRDREARETNGSTFLENHRQLRREEALRAEDGIESAPVAALAGPKEGDDADALLLTAGSAP